MKLEKPNLYESYGIVDNVKTEWVSLSEAIYDYIINNNVKIYSINDIPPKEDKDARKKYINECVINNEKIQFNTLPEWLDDFNIYVCDYETFNMYVNNSGADACVLNYELHNDKIECLILINVTCVKSEKENIVSAIVHEFQHVYSEWIKKYKEGKQDDCDEYNLEEHHDYTGICAIIEGALYHLSNCEIRSFLQQYAYTVRSDFHKNALISQIKHDIKNIKYENRLQLIRQHLYKISKNDVYLLYDGLYKLLKLNINRHFTIQEYEELIKIYKHNQKYINQHLGKPCNVDLTKTYNSEKLVDLIIKKFLKIAENVIKKMHKIYSKYENDFLYEYEKTLNESQGMVDKDGVQWNDLCDLITEYVYDLQSGLNADPFFNGEDGIINLNTIESYYFYKHNKQLPKYTIPDWVGGFIITIKKDKRSNGSFLPRTAKMVDDKLLFDIEVNDSMESPDLLCNTLVHEFQHAYSHWIQLKKNIRFHDRRSAKLYTHAQVGFDDSRYGGEARVPMAMQKFPDLIEIDNTVFTNATHLERIIRTGFYHADIDETRSFIQEFGNDIMRQIRNNFDTIRKEIKQSLEFKGDFNNLTKIDQINSNILNNLSISCYNSKYYKVYKSYYEFYKKLEKMELDDDIAQSAVSKSAGAIRAFFNIPPGKKLAKDGEEANKILHKIAYKQALTYEKVLRKMQKIFVKLIMEIPV